MAGVANFLYLACAAWLGFTCDVRIYVAMTSWVHYCKYIHMYYFRSARGDAAAYAQWQRDVLMFKSLALLNLALIYLAPYSGGILGAVGLGGAGAEPSVPVDYVSLAMICTGYAVSIMATQALGINGTYFGIEVGDLTPANVCTVLRFSLTVPPRPPARLR